MWRMSKWRGADVENERVEWMWTISEEDKVFIAFAKKKFLKYTLISFCFVLMII